MTRLPTPGNRKKEGALDKSSAEARATSNAKTGTAVVLAEQPGAGAVDDDIRQRQVAGTQEDETLQYLPNSSVAEFAGSFEPDYLRYARPHTPWSARLAIWIMLTATVASVIWMAFATVDSQVIARGIVEPLTRKTVVQSFHSGVLKAVDVKVGQRVFEGEPLALIKNETTASDLNSIRFNLVSTRARMERVSAELSGQTRERFSTDTSVEKLERDIFDANKAAHDDAITLFDIQIEIVRDAIKAHQKYIHTMQEQMAYLSELSLLREDLFKKEQEQFSRDGPRRIQFLQAKTAEADGARRLDTLRTELLTLHQKLREAEQKKAQYLSERRAKLSAVLEENAIKLSAAQKQVTKFEEARRLVQLVAPFDGVITSITQKAPGTMIEAGEVMIAMIPVDSRLRAAVDIMPSDIARVRVGAPVTIKLDSLPFNKHGVLRGHVELITNDVEERTVTGQRDLVFRGWIHIDHDELRDKPVSFDIHPGMTLEANIKTKERTVLSYLIYPITRGLSQSLIEP